jgi:putative phosphoesterase
MSVRTDTTAATTIGLIADTHDEIVDWDEVHPKVAAALDGVELILHCGDLQTPAVLERLGEIAPVLAVRGRDDPAASAPRLVDGPRIIVAASATIGLVRRLPDALSTEAFDDPPSVVVFGGTHEALVDTVDGVLFVNPGSPSLAATTSVARLDVGADTPSARIVSLG